MDNQQSKKYPDISGFVELEKIDPLRYPNVGRRVRREIHLVDILDAEDPT
jgi:hypothetical protein